MSTWKALEELYKAGLIRAIGVSNFEISQLEILLENCEIPPMINQIEHTPFLHDEQLNSFCKKNKIQIMAWGPLLRGKMEDAGIKEIAAATQKVRLNYCFDGIFNRELFRFQKRKTVQG